jgi:hypothetical protein
MPEVYKGVHDVFNVSDLRPWFKAASTALLVDGQHWRRIPLSLWWKR